MEIEKGTFANSTAYSAEAYYVTSENLHRMSDSLISLGSFAPELLEAKSEADIEAICKKFHFAHQPHSPCADYNRFRRKAKNWRFSSTAEFVPTYTSWLLERMNTLSVCLQLYAVCLPIARKTAKNTDTANLFNVLYYAHKTHKQMVAEVYHNYEWVPYEDLREWKINRSLCKLPQFPLTSLFDSFQKEEGYKLQEQYGYTFKQIRRRGDLSPPQSQYHYWENPSVQKVARDRLWGYAARYSTDDSHFILTWQPQALAAKCLEIMDRYIEYNLIEVRIQIDSVSGTAKLVTSGKIESALNLWVFTQIQGKTDYRVCKMCGRLFIAGVQKGKKYCDLHKKHEINYYNKTIGRLEKSCSAEVDE